MQKERSVKGFGETVSVCLILFAITLTIWLTAGNGEYLAWQMLRHAPAEKTGLPEEEYSGMGRMVADYLIGKTDEFQYVYTDATGQSVTCFHDYEAAHMADCRELLEKDLAAWIATGLMVMITLAVVLISRRFFLNYFFRGMIIGLRIVMIVAAILAFWAVINFEGFFVTFHWIAFSNDGWRLNPNTDMLIRLMPIDFFIDLGVRGALPVLGVPVLLEAVARIGLWKTTGSWVWDEI